METIEFYKEAIKKTENANRIINRARSDYEHNCELTKNAYEAELYGEQGYKQKLEELKVLCDTEIENALSQILIMAEKYDAEMAELSKLDGNTINDGTMKLLNSGIKLTNEDFQELANTYKDNYVMTRILKDYYNANKPQETGPGITIIKFGQSPAERQEIFSKFVKTLYHACKSSVLPSLVSGRNLKETIDYYNFLAKESLANMQPFGAESFNLDEDFPVRAKNGNLINQTNSDQTEFNFNFTPIRNVF